MIIEPSEIGLKEVKNPMFINRKNWFKERQQFGEMFNQINPQKGQDNFGKN